MEIQIVWLVLIIVFCVGFDFINGFHDAANSIATVVSTRVLTPTQAVLWSAFFNFVAFFIAKYIIGEFGVADTVSKAVRVDVLTANGIDFLPVIFSGLFAAIAWNLFTWKMGIPSSSSHTLIGGLAGAAIAAYGFGAVQSTIILTIIAFIFVAPLIGFLAGNLIMALTLNLCRKAKPHKADKWFKMAQLFSSAALSIGHGLNDSQKEMGIIAITIISLTTSGIELPQWMAMNDMGELHDWIPVICFTAIAAGTMSGGWKIMKTMGNKITKVTPVEGFCAQTAGAITLFITQMFKVPVSTTHVISGSIMGVGAVKRLSAVRWGVTLELVTAWILTIPISAAIAMGVYCVVKMFL